MRYLFAIALLFTSSLAAVAFEGEKHISAYGRVAAGVFAPVDQKHEIAGSFKIEQRGQDFYLVFSKDFVVSEGPDLKVVLRSSTQPSMEILAPLTKFAGMQEYAIGLTKAELLMFNQVVVYCQKFHVDFGIGSIDYL